jgi:hypothetical protein
MTYYCLDQLDPSARPVLWRLLCQEFPADLADQYFLSDQ